MKLKLKQFNFLIFLIIPAVAFSQLSSNEKLMEMKNSFALGLQDKGLEIASVLMSRNEYKDVREETVFYIAEYHFVNSLIQPELKDRLYYANVSYTYYLIYKNDYSSSTYSSLVEKRITTLISTNNQLGILRNLFDYYFTEAAIVQNSINFTNQLFTVYTPNPYYFFFEGENKGDAIKILERYYDDIIVNHPEYEIYGYHWKIISNLSVLSGVDYFSDGVMKFNVEKISYNRKSLIGVINNSEKFVEIRKKLLSWLEFLNNKYPHNPITLDFNLVFAKLFMVKEDESFDLGTKKHLEFVVQNELDKTHPRYMLAKEFLLNNKFK